MKPPWLFMLY